MNLRWSAVSCIFASLVATTAHASDDTLAPAASSSAAPAPSTPVPATTASPSPTTTTAGPGVAPPSAAPEFTPDPDSEVTSHWYGWQPLIFDAAALVQAIIAYSTDLNALYATAGATYYVGPVVTHIVHGRAGNVLLSAASRLVLPGVGAGVGFLIARLATPSASSDGGTVVGLDTGLVGAAAFDDAWIARETVHPWELQSSGFTVTPTISRRFSGLTLHASF